MSLRAGGVSAGPWASLNLGAAVGDDPAAVVQNRARFSAALAAQPVWLRQVHGNAVLRLDAGSVTCSGAELPPADAAWTTERGLACTVLVADCLPVLMSTRCGRAVAAAHAGWRGLAAGVLEATLAALQQGVGAPPAEVQVWMGPCIGPQAFEVGADVLLALGHQPAGAAAPAHEPPHPDPAFVPRTRPDGSARWLANLQLLAHRRLQAAGVMAIHATARCTVGEASDFFSFRRDGVTGRHAAAIWLG